MANFAELNENNEVLAVYSLLDEDLEKLTGESNDEKATIFFNKISGNNNIFIQTSYNKNFRVNYAGIGYTYDVNKNAFIPPFPNYKPIDSETGEILTGSWVLNNSTFIYEFIQ